MAKFGINDILNAKTKAAGQQAQTDGYKEIYLSPYEVKAAQENTHQKLENIQENVCTHFGTNMDILQNKFDENTWNAYYEGKIEPFAIQLSLVMTNMSFTERERAFEIQGT